MRSKNSTFSQARCASALLYLNMWKSNYPHRHVNAIALHIFCGRNCKTSRICYQWTRFFTITAGWQLTTPGDTCNLVPVTHHDVSVTSRLAKILTNCHILLKYFELVSLQLSAATDHAICLNCVIDFNRAKVIDRKSNRLNREAIHIRDAFRTFFSENLTSTAQ